MEKRIAFDPRLRDDAVDLFFWRRDGELGRWYVDVDSLTPEGRDELRGDEVDDYLWYCYTHGVPPGDFSRLRASLSDGLILWEDGHSASLGWSHYTACPSLRRIRAEKGPVVEVQQFASPVERPCELCGSEIKRDAPASGLHWDNPPKRRCRNYWVVCDHCAGDCEAIHAAILREAGDAEALIDRAQIKFKFVHRADLSGK